MGWTSGTKSILLVGLVALVSSGVSVAKPVRASQSAAAARGSEISHLDAKRMQGLRDNVGRQGHPDGPGLKGSYGMEERMLRDSRPCAGHDSGGCASPGPTSLARFVVRRVRFSGRCFVDGKTRVR